MSYPNFITTLANPAFLDFDSVGNLYIANFGNGTITKYGPDGSPIGNNPLISGLHDPYGIAFDSADNLYVTNNSNSTVTKYTSAGVPIGANPFISQTGSGLTNPQGLAFDSLGDLYVVNNTIGTVTKYTSAGVKIGTNPLISNLVNPHGIIFDSAGDLYISHNNSIQKFTSAGFPIGTNPFISSLANPHGLAFDFYGNLYVANFMNSRIGKYNSSGTLINADLITIGVSNPQGICFDFYGNLYVANNITKVIGKFLVAQPPTPTISFISPISGLISGGTSVTITGTNFVPNITTVKFGSNSATSVNVNNLGTSITCVTPIGLAGSADVVVTTSGVLETLTNGFSYVSPPTPTISSISPISGLISGGTSVTITGTNFVPNITTVKFGSASATSVNVNSSGTSITCVTPIGLAGLANVVVTTDAGLETLTNGFDYVAPISNICFPAGTPITTNQGTFPIEKINQAIHTIRNKKIVGITQTVTQDKYLVCFEKDSLGINLPSQKTIISKNHGIFYKGKMIHSKEFINKFENVKKIKYTGEILYNVLMEDHDKMMVNNLICETLHPENGTAKLYKCLQNLNPKEQQNLIENCNEYSIKNKVFSSKKITK